MDLVLYPDSPHSDSSGASSSSPLAQPAPLPLSLTPAAPEPSPYESQKRRDWITFELYLRNHRPPLSPSRCSGAHVLEFLWYLDQFGEKKVHTQMCPFFGHPNPPASCPCPCPLRQAWSSLNALVGRLRVAYEENGGTPESNPFGASVVRLYLREVREHQAKACGITYGKKKRKKPAQQDQHPPPPPPPETTMAMDHPFLRQRVKDGSKGVICEKPPSPCVSAVSESDIFGREKDKEKLIDMLLHTEEEEESSGRKLCVIPIAGMPGVGKTTLAQLVYNDPRVQGHYDLRGWVCLSRDFDVATVTQEVVRSLTGTVCDLVELDDLQSLLSGLLESNRVLIVLDDAANEQRSPWESFQAPLFSAAFCTVIVTTQNDEVAEIVGTVPPYHLHCLTEEDCWSLFKRHAFPGAFVGEDSSTQTTVLELGKKIVHKCGGLPLAIKALGNTLCYQNVAMWETVAQCRNIYELDVGVNLILPALKLNLPRHLRPLLAYCSLFPKEYKFKKGQLVRLWVAQGLIDCRRGNPEDSGCNFFEELVGRSFFQCAGSNNEADDRYEMHVLVHELSHFVSGKECCTIESGSSLDIPEEVRHVFLASGKPRKLGNEQSLSTYMYIHNCRLKGCPSLKIPNVLFQSLTLLWTLELSCSGIEELPDSIGDLIHLRYLRLKGSIKYLPESVCHLYNLQTLDLFDCKSLIEVPGSIGNLVNLRHLDLPLLARDDPLPFDLHVSSACLPLGIGNLTSLQTLVGICVGRDKCSIGELKCLVNLRGQFCISGLEDLTNMEDAEKACLENKEFLQILKLEWRNTRFCGHADVNLLDIRILDSLRPHANLTELAIKGYGGARFPRWLGDPSFFKLTIVRLVGCRHSHCEVLPPLGQLPSLICLSIGCMPGVQLVGREFCCLPSNMKGFPLLHELSFDEMPEWEEWSEVLDDDFPCLKSLAIKYCPKLRRIPTFLSLTSLHLSDCSKLMKVPTLPKLQSLAIHECEDLSSIPLHRSLSALQELTIGYCRQLTSLTGLHHLVPLKNLSVSCCPELRLELHEQLPPMLQNVDIKDCPLLSEWCQFHGFTHKDVVQFEETMYLPQLSYRVDNSVIYGREKDKQRVMELVLSGNFSVIRIVAAGGVGKTALAHLVYNDFEICETFDTRGWVCVSENFDDQRITRAIIESFTQVSCGLTELNELQEIIKEELVGKRFLLVLDNACNENQSFWNNLLIPLGVGGKGSVVIVTTQNGAVANNMERVHTHLLGRLTYDDCWLIFQERAMGDLSASSDSKYIEVGKKIVVKCEGIPLAVKALGGLLHNATDDEEWNAVLGQEILGREDILPALRICYDLLPVCLKQCFVYCSLFPKDYIFEKDHLIRIWIAQGFIEPREGKQREDIGVEYIDELLVRSFFQHSQIYDVEEGKFVMHDLVYDLLQEVTGPSSEYLRIEDEKLSSIPEEVHHASLIPCELETVIQLEAFKEPRDLHTFLLINKSVLRSDGRQFHVQNLEILDDLFEKCRCLRTLDLSYTNIKELPCSIGNLKSLSYLGLNNTNIKRLPDTMTRLYSLQTLELEECNYLLELPKSIDNLVNLRHLNVWKESGFIFIPPGVGKLINLQTLATFNVGGDKWLCEIKELRKLENLRGKLRIGGLENVISGKEAKRAYLKNKKYLQAITFQWFNSGRDLVDDDGEVIAAEVLQSLEPHSRLQELIIRDYPGCNFPIWLGDHSFSELVTIFLDNCFHCEKLPTLGGLQSLRYLSIRRMQGVQHVGAEFCGFDTTILNKFPSLEILRLWEMYQWEEWSEVGHQDFPHLRRLSISGCPKLKNLPYFPSLVELSIHCFSQLPDLPDLPSLRSLKIQGFHNHQSLSLPPALPALKVLDISSCNRLSSVEGLEDLTSLEKLKLTKCPMLSKWCPDGFHEETEPSQAIRNLIRQDLQGRGVYQTVGASRDYVSVVED